MDSIEEELENKDVRPSFPAAESQDLLLLQSPVLFEKHVKPPRKPLNINIQIFPSKGPNAKIQISTAQLARDTNRKKSISIIPRLLLSPFIRQDQKKKEKSIIIQQSAKLKTNEGLKDYYREKMEENDPQTIIRNHLRKISRKLSKQYSKILPANGKIPKFQKLSQLTIGVLKIKEFCRRRRTKKYVALFANLLESNEMLTFNSMPEFNFGGIESLHSRLIRRNPHSDPFFISVIEKRSLSALVREYHSSKNTKHELLEFLARGLRFCCQTFLDSRTHILITVLIIIINCICLYKEFAILEASLPLDQCLDLTTFPSNNNGFHSANQMILYYFLFEIIIKLIGLGLRGFFHDIWNLFDLVILVISFYFMDVSGSYFQPSPFRIFRFVNLIRIKALHSMFQSLYRSLLLLSETFFIFIFFISLFAIAGTQIFGGLLKNKCFEPEIGFLSTNLCGSDVSVCQTGLICVKGIENPEFGAMSFDEFPASFLQTLRIMTLSLWSVVMYDMQRCYSIYSWIYFFILIIIGNFFLLNLTLAVLKVKFSENLEKTLEKHKTHEPKSFNFKALIQRKVIKSSKDLALKAASFSNRRASQQLYQRGRFELKQTDTNDTREKTDNDSKENSLKDSKQLENAPQRQQKFKYISLSITSVCNFMKKLLKKIKKGLWDVPEDDTQDLNRFRLEIVINHSQEYHSMSLSDVLQERETKKLEQELAKHQLLLKNAHLPRDFSIERSRLTMALKREEKSKNRPSVLKSQSMRKHISNAMSLRKSILSNLNSIRKSSGFSIHKQSIFSPINALPKPFSYPILNNPQGINLINPKVPNITAINSPQKASPKKTSNELKLLIERKIQRNRETLGFSFDYRTVKERINESLDPPQEDKPPDDWNIPALYVRIIEKDLSLQKVSNNHWSGYSVLPSHVKNIKIWLSWLLSIDTANPDIWLTGITGMFKTLLGILESICESAIFANITFAFTLMSLVELSLEGSIDDTEAQTLFSIIAHYFLVEFAIKILVMRPQKYWRSIMNRIDLIVLVYSLALIYFATQIDEVETNTFKSLRLLKILLILRVFRLLSRIEYMTFILQVLSTTFDYFIYLAFFLVLLVVACALVSKQVFSQGCDFSLFLSQEKTFQSFLATLITVFNLVTLDTWNSLLTASSQVGLEVPMICLSLFLIFFGNFVILNLFIAIMLDSFEAVNRRVEEQLREKHMELKKTNKQRYLELKDKALKQNEEEGGGSDFEGEITLSPEAQSPGVSPLRSPMKSSCEIEYFKNEACKHSLGIFSKDNSFRRFSFRTVHSPWFEYLVYILIASVGVLLALDTFFDTPSTGIQIANLLINFGFLFECFLKIISGGLILDRGSYLRDYRNILDVSTIILAFLGLFASTSDALRGLLLIRLWRPMSLIYKRKYINDLLSALLSSLYQIVNVFLAVFIVWLVFSIIGIQLFHDRFGFCEYRSNFGVSQDQCAEENGKWEIFVLNFDNIYHALVSIFALSTLDNWANLLNLAVNSDIAERGPSRNNNQYSSYVFFISFVFIAVWLFFNLFIGVIFTNFMEISRKNLHPFLTSVQVRWLEIQSYILGVSSHVYTPPETGIRSFVYKALNTKLFAFALDSVLFINFLALCLDGQTFEKRIWLRSLLFFINGFLLLEAGCKLFVYQRDYFSVTKWNTFNLLAAIVYLLDLLISEGVLFNINASPFAFRVFRACRILKVISFIRIIEKLTGLKALILNLLLSWRLILNMVLLMFIVIFIYSVIGVYMFKGVHEGETINEFNNFKNLFYALMALFKCVTREQWFDLMFDLNKVPPHCEESVNCGSLFAPLYFVSFMIINTYIVFNLFILILLQQFEEFHKNTFNPMITFKQHINTFKQVWNKYCTNHEKKLHITKIVGFLKELGPPLGNLKKNIRIFFFFF